MAIVGFVPAMSVTADTSAADLRSGAGSRPRRRRRSSRLLAIGQVALSTFVVIGATMFVRTLVNLWSVEAGFETRDVLMAHLTPPRGAQQPALPAVFEDIRGRLASVPGVEAVSDDDREGSAEVAIVNESFARRFLDPGSAVGRRFGIAADDRAALEIVGVVEDSKWESLREDPVPMYYRPFVQRPAPSAALVVHAPGRLAVAERTVRDLARALEGRVEIVDIVPFATIVGRTLGTERMLARISTALGMLALAVVAIGLYGLTAFEVAQRARELGIRLALGAPGAQLVHIVTRDTLTILALGVPAGLIAVLIGARAVSALLFGLTPTDPMTVIIGIGALVAVALTAAYVPARKIALIEPSVVLRNE